MHRILAVMALLVSTMLAATLAACQPNAAEQPIPVDIGGCYTPGEGQRLLQQDDMGICLLYPAEMNVASANAGQILLQEIVGSDSGPRIEISVEPANGVSLDEAAANYVAQRMGDPGFPIDRRETTLGGQPAVILEAFPGVNLSRAVLVIDNDRLFIITGEPIIDSTPAVALAERSFQLIVETWVFMPATP